MTFLLLFGILRLLVRLRDITPRLPHPGHHRRLSPPALILAPSLLHSSSRVDLVVELDRRTRGRYEAWFVAPSLPRLPSFAPLSLRASSQLITIKASEFNPVRGTRINFGGARAAAIIGARAARVLNGLFGSPEATVLGAAHFSAGG